MEQSENEKHAEDIELGGVDAKKLVGGFVYPNSLSSREMESLTALCDTILPSIDVSGDASTCTDESLITFYRTSASMAGTPDRLGGLISERLEHPMKWLMRLSLWLLSTWIGTFILCGRGSLSTQFPYFRSFAQVSQQKREQIVVSWSLSYFHLLRMFFKTIKLLTLLVFFTQVDENEENLSWKAIGYTGPDPDILNKTNLSTALTRNGYERPDTEEQEYQRTYKEEFFGPLYHGIINLSKPKDVVANSLMRFGIPVSVIYSPKTSSDPSLIFRCDAVVIGSGSGGGVVAGVLAKAGYKVIVLDKGDYHARKNLTLLEGPTMDQMYLSGGLVATDDMGVLLLAGSTVGGGSTINWSASIRTPQHVSSEWYNHHGLELFDSQLYQEAMDIVCQRMGVQSDIHEEGFSNAVLRRGCQELGYPVHNIPRNAGPDHYCGWCCLGCKDGSKKGTSETWLVDLVRSGNGAIFSGCEAIKVLHTRTKGRARNAATGVMFEFKHEGAKQVCVVESKVTIVACGALSTPILLNRSGLKNANIGKNLHLHPVAMAWGYFNNPDSPNLSEKKSYEGGIMTAMSTVTADFDRSGYGALIQTPALHPGMFSIVMPWISGKDIKHRMSKFSKTAHIFALARDKGSGTVLTNAPNSVSYQMEPVDENNLNRGLEKSLRILAAAGAEEIGTHHFKGKSLNVKKASSGEFEQFVKEESSRPLRDISSSICSAHQMGSCRMGVNAKGSVVNQMGETWEVEGLFVADSSVFPTALGVNPMVTVQCIAYCTAQSVIQVLQRRKPDV
ncbi:putative long-chain-alcohol oxidase [Rosa chinensis]|uniref:Long-chain-alcohol oxidase n=1 Tax=Rosa chinensis TaxID=74649 RepID=A0A2P6PBF8_ROSCH|nr:long-chain-alcohol oxidase FAO4A [Rosa chinensis]PRQ19259.1 putative long-chain-alcohol oxidase [Rosa chinensis]